MATSKEYAYYIKGNKVAIVQKDWTFSGGQTLSQPGLNDLGAAGALFWKSPKESVTNGLEMQYVYSPQYMTSSNAVATAGGAKGSTYTFTYLAANLVHVDANAYITTGTVATTAAASVTGGI